MLERSPGMRCDAARTVAQVTGLRFCGMVEEPPRPSPEGSASSAISVCACRQISRAILPSVPVQRPRAAAISTMRSRWVCQGIAGRVKCSCSDNAFATAGPRPERAASVPTAPPNCTARLRVRNSDRRERWRRIASSHPATIKPNVVGRACCIHVRAATGVARYLSARIARVADRRARSWSTSSKRAAYLQHHAGIHRVLAGGAPVNEARGIFVLAGDDGGEVFDERNSDVAGKRGLRC